MTRHQLNLDDAAYSKLTELKKRLGFASFSALVVDLALRLGAAPAKANLSELTADRRPFIISGPSGCGKTTLAKKVLDSWPGSVLVFDVSREYPGLRIVKDSRDIPFKKGGRVRILADADAGYSSIQATYLFRDLARARSPELASWLIIVEEGHRFTGDGNLRDLILEARKTFGKLLVLSADASAWAQIAPVVRP